MGKSTAKKRIKVPPGYRLIFRRYKTDKNTGRKIPPPPGCRAWPLLVPIEPVNDNN